MTIFEPVLTSLAKTVVAIPLVATCMFIVLWRTRAWVLRAGRRFGKYLRRRYTRMIGLTAIVLSPIWVWLVLEISYSLYVQLAETLPPPGSNRKEYISSVGLTITGLAALLAAPFFLLKTWINERLAKTTEEGHVTDRISKAVEHLAATKEVKRVYLNKDGNPHLDERNVPIVQSLTEPNREVRIGGIYALERISQDSERDHIQIMEILCAYIRENATEPRIDSSATAEDAEAPVVYRAPRVDIQTALTVIGRREQARIDYEQAQEPGYQLDLNGVEIAEANLIAADLRGANLGRARLQGAYLTHANLQEAWLAEANLKRARLVDANTQGAWLQDTNLEGAWLWRANLNKARLENANLNEAMLEDANLQEALLRDANLQGARLTNANLQKAKLRDANLQGAWLQDSNLRGTWLPGGNLQGATLRGANLQEAILEKANMQQTRLTNANLQSATLKGANLQGAILSGANLKLADLSDCAFSRTFLRSTVFTGCTTLSQDAVNASFGVKSGYGKTILPDGLHAPDHWHEAAPADQDTPELLAACSDAHTAWLRTQLNAPATSE